MKSKEVCRNSQDISCGIRKIARVDFCFGSEIAHARSTFPSCSIYPRPAGSTAQRRALKLLLQIIYFEGVSWRRETGFPL